MKQSIVTRKHEDIREAIFLVQLAGLTLPEVVLTNQRLHPSWEEKETLNYQLEDDVNLYFKLLKDSSQSGRIDGVFFGRLFMLYK